MYISHVVAVGTLNKFYLLGQLKIRMIKVCFLPSLKFQTCIIFCKAGILATISFSFCFCFCEGNESNFFLWTFYRAQISSLVNFFPLNTLNISLYSCLNDFWEEAGCNSYLYFTSGKVFFPSGFFQEFFLYFWFSAV
jgi:hypothetical protein